MRDFDENEIIHNLKIDAHAVGIPEGAAETFIERTIKDVKKSLKNRSIITENDLHRAILKELRKYHADLAYVYENRDKII